MRPILECHEAGGGAAVAIPAGLRHAARVGLAAFVLGAAGLGAGATAAADEAPLKLGIVTFLSGPAAGPFGIPAADAARLIVDAINEGALPAPYDSPGIAGVPIEAIVIDEAGGTTKQVTEFRNLALRRGVDAVVGYISSGSCLGVAPVAEELKLLTILFECGTPRIFEERAYRYVFRTRAHGTMDGVAAARYVDDRISDLRTYAGINQNYAWGQDSWRDFALAMAALDGTRTVTTAQFPKLFAGQYNAEISALMVNSADVVHTSLWGGDLESFLLQAGARGLPERAALVLTTGEHLMYSFAGQMPEGVILGARGPYGDFARPTPLNAWFRDAYLGAFATPPVFPAYDMATAILGLKVATEKAAAAAGGTGRPEVEAVIDAFEYLDYEAFGTTVRMPLGGGHQAVTETAYGRLTTDPETGAPRLIDVTRYPADCVNPPAGTTSVAWIQAGMPGARCE
ncbi:MAG: ABC transporter substrate-binding protein [Alphaproteobacteria bacterium]|jgi:branched-chain amino acid transport system substrate-binding protein|nr:ABC transporter substrate-binding protein [Alphaproteobacteria bacterium]MDP6515212.1 ABC transporter substrate-binding protein [Alphaproteobacteria bacterium]